MVFIQDIVRGTELTIASGGPPGGLPAATADRRQTPSPALPLDRRFFFFILFRGNRQIPGLATGAVGHSLFYSRR